MIQHPLFIREPRKFAVMALTKIAMEAIWHAPRCVEIMWGKVRKSVTEQICALKPVRQEDLPEDLYLVSRPPVHSTHPLARLHRRVLTVTATVMEIPHQQRAHSRHLTATTRVLRFIQALLIFAGTPLMKIAMDLTLYARSVRSDLRIGSL